MNYVTFCRFEPDTFSPVVNRRAGRWRVVNSHDRLPPPTRPLVIPAVDAMSRELLLCFATQHRYHPGVLINPAKAIVKKVVDRV